MNQPNPGATASAETSLLRRFPQLETRYGPLIPMDSGMQSRVYLGGGGELVVKVYRDHKGEHRQEAANMRRADMGQWVLATPELDGVEVLVMRRFPGHPLQAADVPRALPRLREILSALHQQQQGAVALEKVARRLTRFRSALSSYDLDDLFQAVEVPFDAGLLRQPASFCHLDLWHDNILIADNGDVLVIDWNRAAPDDPLRDLALLKTGTLDLLSAPDSLQAALSFLPDDQLGTLRRYRTYVALTTLHDLYWFLMNEPYEFDAQKERKVRRARHVLMNLPE